VKTEKVESISKAETNDTIRPYGGHSHQALPPGTFKLHGLSKLLQLCLLRVCAARLSAGIGRIPIQYSCSSMVHHTSISAASCCRPFVFGAVCSLIATGGFRFCISAIFFSRGRADRSGNRPPPDISPLIYLAVRIVDKDIDFTLQPLSSAEPIAISMRGNSVAFKCMYITKCSSSHLTVMFVKFRYYPIHPPYGSI